MSDQERELLKLHNLIDDDKSELDDLKASLAKIDNKVRLEWTEHGNPLVWAVKKNRRDLIKHMVNIDKFNINDISKNCQVERLALTICR